MSFLQAKTNLEKRKAIFKEVPSSLMLTITNTDQENAKKHSEAKVICYLTSWLIVNATFTFSYKELSESEGPAFLFSPISGFDV